MQAHAFEFGGNIARRNVVARSSRLAAFQQAVGEKTNVRPDLLRADCFGR